MERMPLLAIAGPDHIRHRAERDDGRRGWRSRSAGGWRPGWEPGRRDVRHETEALDG